MSSIQVIFYLLVFSDYFCYPIYSNAAPCLRKTSKPVPKSLLDYVKVKTDDLSIILISRLEPHYGGETHSSHSLHLIRNFVRTVLDLLLVRHVGRDLAAVLGDRGPSSSVPLQQL